MGVSMKKELFIKQLNKYGVIITPVNDNPLFDRAILKEFRLLKNFIKFINFDCQIKEKCPGIENDSTGGCKVTPQSLKCCCSGCVDSAGYFRKMIQSELNFYAKKFSVKTGFWRKGMGCILEHKMRSTTCLTHHCNYEDIPGFDLGVSNLRHRLYNLRAKI